VFDGKHSGKFVELITNIIKIINLGDLVDNAFAPIEEGRWSFKKLTPVASLVSV